MRRPFKKIDPEKLKEYVKANPEAYLSEIAVMFGVLQQLYENP
ncbi:MAG: hypothetical protein IJ859_10995 [Synergistaceae bacterium]|nr:hypothetical protein [Synergistaceae bacterium]